MVANVEIHTYWCMLVFVCKHNSFWGYVWMTTSAYLWNHICVQIWVCITLYVHIRICGYPFMAIWGWFTDGNRPQEPKKGWLLRKITQKWSFGPVIVLRSYSDMGIWAYVHMQIQSYADIKKCLYGRMNRWVNPIILICKSSDVSISQYERMGE